MTYLSMKPFLMNHLKYVLQEGRIPKKPEFVISRLREILKRPDFSHLLDMTRYPTFVGLESKSMSYIDYP